MVVTLVGVSDREETDDIFCIYGAGHCEGTGGVVVLVLRGDSRGM